MNITSADRIIPLTVFDRFKGVELWWEFEDNTPIQFEDEERMGQDNSQGFEVRRRTSELTAVIRK